MDSDLEYNLFFIMQIFNSKFIVVDIINVEKFLIIFSYYGETPNDRFIIKNKRTINI